MASYRRRLPHIHQPGEPLFVTWRLAGSLPENRSFRRDDLTSGQVFAAFDRLLDLACTGPLYLRHPEFAAIVAERLADLARAGDVYELHAFVVMPNHVHLLLTPIAPLPRVTRLIKGATARHANLLLGRSGKAFWQDESYDHRVKGHGEFSRIRRYIEFNPVRAGLVAAAEDFPYSSASSRWSSLFDHEPQRG